jgi:hypothetical protein
MIVFALFLSLTFGWASEFKSYRIGSMLVIFHEVDGQWVNKSCENDKCLALAMGKKFRNSKVPSELLRGGKNPFAVRCKTVMKGKVLIGLTKSGNEQSLCHFSDDSFLH